MQSVMFIIKHHSYVFSSSLSFIICTTLTTVQLADDTCTNKHSSYWLWI